LKLRLKTLLVVAAAMAVLFVALFLLIRFSLERQFAALERHSASDDIARVEAAVLDDIRQLDRIAADWAPRDQTYRFMRGESPRFLTELSEEALSNLGVNVMLFLDSDGEVVHAESFDLDLGVRQEMDAATLRALLASPDLQRPADPRSRVTGLLRTGDRVMLVAARSITSSDLYAPPAGTLVLARDVDSTEVERLAGVTKLDVHAKPASLTSDSTVRNVLAAIDASRSILIKPVDARTLGAYAAMSDVSGVPALVLSARLPRDIYAQGQDAIAYAALAMFIIGVAATATVTTVVDRGVLGRIGLLSSEMASIGVRRDTSARVTVVGSDELAGLAEDVNDALAAIDDSERDLRAARDQLEDRVRDRTVELRASEARFRILIEQMADALFCVDPRGRITFVNSAAEDLTGLDAAELEKCRFVDIMSSEGGDDIAARIAGDLRPDSTWTVEARVVTADRAPVPVELSASPLLDEHARIAGTQWVARDITERKRFEQQMLHVASHDHLTGLRNRRYFETALEIELAEARRDGGTGAIVWLDVDDFKDVNDTLGHRAGDEVLVELADQLRKEVRESNVLARLGGDEFGVLIPGASVAEATVAATRVLNAINSRPFSVDGHAVTLSASLGVVAYPDHGTTPAELLANADMAMYWAKDRGRSQVHVHEMDAMREQEMRARTRWNDRILAALREDSMRVYAQPILDLHTGLVTRLELLSRMLDGDGAPILPAEYLPTAERSGLINDIDRWMVQRAVAILAGTQDWALQLEVNLSGKAFLDSTLLPTIKEALIESGVEPARLGFEITETAAIADIGRAQTFVAALKELGCRFSLDDFGSGFSSFYHLKHLPIDCLKIDGSFIRGLSHGLQDRHLVRGMVELSRGLDIEVAAEYVEDADTLEIVRSLGIDYAQGFQVGHPVPVSQALEELSAMREREV